MGKTGRARGEPDTWLDIPDVGRYLRLPLINRWRRVTQFQDRDHNPLPYVFLDDRRGQEARLTKKEWIDDWLLREYDPTPQRIENLATPQTALWGLFAPLWEDLVELSNRARDAGVKWHELPPPPPEEVAEIRMLVLSALRAAVLTRMDELEGDEGIKRLAYEVDVRYRSEARYARSHEGRR